MPSVREAARSAYIVAHREPLDPLIAALRGEGLEAKVVRGPYSEEQRTYSAALRCLVNHANAWRQIALSGEMGLVVEADFVPVRGLGMLPLPCPEDRIDNALIYLYACGPQFWERINDHIARGHAGGMVAYVISPAVAESMLTFYEEHLAANRSGAYSTWDASLGYWLQARGTESYLPYRQYGEHGGLWNPEHRKVGLRRPHRADVLQGRLAFLPLYSRGHALRFRVIRLKSYAHGWGRLLTGRVSRFRDARRVGYGFILQFLFGRMLVPTPAGLRRWQRNTGAQARPGSAGGDRLSVNARDA